MDISFSCHKCEQRIVIDSEGAGLTVNCPNCQAELVVPSADTSGAPAPLKLKLVISPEPAGKTHETGVTAGKSLDEGGKCPSCGKSLPKDAILCVNCGFNLKTKQKVETYVGSSDPLRLQEPPPIIRPGIPPLLAPMRGPSEKQFPISPIRTATSAHVDIASRRSRGRFQRYEIYQTASIQRTLRIQAFSSRNWRGKPLAEPHPVGKSTEIPLSRYDLIKASHGESLDAVLLRYLLAAAIFVFCTPVGLLIASFFFGLRLYRATPQIRIQGRDSKDYHLQTLPDEESLTQVVGLIRRNTALEICWTEPH